MPADPPIPTHTPCWVLQDATWQPGWLHEWKPAASVGALGRGGRTDGSAGLVTYVREATGLRHYLWLHEDSLADRTRPAPEVEDGTPPWEETAPPWNPPPTPSTPHDGSAAVRRPPSVAITRPTC